MNLNQRLPLRDDLRPKTQRFEESPGLPEWADEHLDELRRDSWVGKCIMILAATCGLMGLIKFAVEKFHLLNL